MAETNPTPKTEEVKVVMIHPNELERAKYNPPERTNHANKRFQDLLKAIRKAGKVLQPVQITKTKEIIDGHRRTECCKIIGLEVPCIIHDLDGQKKDSVFEMVNTTTSKLTPTDELYIYLKGGHISRTTERVIEYLLEFKDRKFLQEVVKLGVSPVSYYSAVKHVCGYLDDHTDRMVTRVLDHVHRKGTAYVLRRAVQDHIPASKLKKHLQDFSIPKKTW